MPMSGTTWTFYCTAQGGTEEELRDALMAVARCSGGCTVAPAVAAAEGQMTARSMYENEGRTRFRRVIILAAAGAAEI